MPAPRPAIYISPPLVASEVAFLIGFARDGANVHRVWPGQPSRHCPWRPTAGGRSLELDLAAAKADPEKVAGWLRFLVQEFLAPASARALTAALAEGLRGGHVMSGVVVIDDVCEISVDNNRTSERVLSSERDAVVLQLDAKRKAPRPGVVRTGARLHPSGTSGEHQSCVER